MKLFHKIPVFFERWLPLEASPLKEVREDLFDDSGMEKKHEEQGKSKVSLNPEQCAIFGHMFKMYQTHNVSKS